MSTGAAEAIRTGVETEMMRNDQPGTAPLIQVLPEAHAANHLPVRLADQQILRRSMGDRRIGLTRALSESGRQLSKHYRPLESSFPPNRTPARIAALSATPSRLACGDPNSRLRARLMVLSSAIRCPTFRFRKHMRSRSQYRHPTMERY